jgi:uridine kinase
MHLEFVEPSKRNADIIIPEGGYNQVGTDLVIQKIRSLIPQSGRSRTGDNASGFEVV